MILSTVASYPMEEMAAALGDSLAGFSSTGPRNDELAASFIPRAERAGYGAIVVTLDTDLLESRRHDMQNAYLPFFRGEGLAGYFSDPGSGRPSAAICDRTLSGHREFLNSLLGARRTPGTIWADCVSRPGCRFVVKGVLDPDDARKAVEKGAAGVIVSNHGIAGDRRRDGRLDA